MAYNDKIPGWFEIEDFESLEFLVKLVPENGNIIELGSFLGRSSWCMAKTCHPTVKVHCFDYWYDPFFCKRESILPGQIVKPAEKIIEMAKKFNCSVNELFPVEKRFIENTKDCSNVIGYATRIQDIEWNKNNVDLIFLDALYDSDKEFKGCIRYWKNKLTPNGIISGHDYQNSFPQKKMWIDQLANEFSQKVVILNTKSSVWYLE